MVFLRITDFVLKTKVYIFTFFRIFFPNFLVFSSLLPTYLFPALYFRYFIEWNVIAESNFRQVFLACFNFFFVLYFLSFLLSITRIIFPFWQSYPFYHIFSNYLPLIHLFTSDYSSSLCSSEHRRFYHFFSFLSFVFRLLFYQKYIEKTFRRSRTKLRIFRASIFSVV